MLCVKLGRGRYLNEVNQKDYGNLKEMRKTTKQKQTYEPPLFLTLFSLLNGRAGIRIALFLRRQIYIALRRSFIN